MTTPLGLVCRGEDMKAKYGAEFKSRGLKILYL